MVFLSLWQLWFSFNSFNQMMIEDTHWTTLDEVICFEPVGLLELTGFHPAKLTKLYRWNVDNYVIMVVQADTVSYVTSYHHIIWETTGNYLHQLFGLWWTGRIHSTHMYHFRKSTRFQCCTQGDAESRHGWRVQTPGIGKDHFPRSWNSNPLDMSHMQKSTEIFQDDHVGPVEIFFSTSHSRFRLPFENLQETWRLSCFSCTQLR